MGHRSQLAQSLSQVALFATCSKSDLKILCRHMVEAEVGAGAEIVREGEVADAFYVVIEGRATVSSRKGNRSVVTGKLGPGSSFGELAILDPAPRNATVVAETPMVLGVLGARVFRAVLRDVPSMTEKLLAAMARRLRDADRLLAGGRPPSAATSRKQGHGQRRSTRSAAARKR